SGSEDRTARVWDLQRPEEFLVLKPPTTGPLAPTDADRILNFRDVERGRSMTLRQHTNGILAVAFSPDGHTIPAVAAGPAQRGGRRGCGRRPGEGRCRPCAGRRRLSTASPSAPTAGGWPRAQRISRCASGTSPTAWSCAPTWGTPGTLTRWPTAPTASRSPRR